MADVATESGSATTEVATEQEAQEVVDQIHKLIRESEKAAERIKELAEDEKLPGMEGRIASHSRARQRRKSKDLASQFQNLMSDKLERVFKQFDADGNGTLDRAELKEAFKATGQEASDETIDKAISILDSNGDGVLE